MGAYGFDKRRWRWSLFYYRDEVYNPGGVSVLIHWERKR